MFSNDVLDALANFAVFVKHAAAAVWASARACVRVDGDLRQNGDCSLHRRAAS